MTQHDHREYVPGCFRCDLSREEAWDEGYQRGLRDAEQDVQHGADNPYREERTR